MQVEEHVQDPELSAKYDFGDVSKLTKLGSGSFADVVLATCRADQTEWALKIVDKDRLTKKDKKQLEVEVAAMEAVASHAGIVDLRETVDLAGAYTMVLEPLHGLDLFDAIEEAKRYDEPRARRDIRHVCEALSFCHARGVIHRDIKVENLIYVSKDASAALKIIDFGLCVVLKEPGGTCPALPKGEFFGTPHYLAPEVVQGVPYGAPIDCWAVGCVLYYMLIGDMPFDDNEGDNVTANGFGRLFKRIAEANVPEIHPGKWGKLSDGARGLITELLQPNPTDRMSMARVLEGDAWLNAAG